jgi:hypothetical protein
LASFGARGGNKNTHIVDFTTSMLPWQLHGNPQEVSSKFPNPKKCILNPKKWIFSTNFSPKN